MTDATTQKMPLESLDAYRVAKEVLKKVVAAQIRDAKLRDQAVRAAQSTCLNIAEAVGRWSGADRVRVFRIARGECCEVAAAIEIAQISSCCSAEAATDALQLAGRLYAILTGLSRR